LKGYQNIFVKSNVNQSTWPITLPNLYSESALWSILQAYFSQIYIFNCLIIIINVVSFDNNILWQLNYLILSIIYEYLFYYWHGESWKLPNDTCLEFWLPRKKKVEHVAYFWKTVFVTTFFGHRNVLSPFSDPIGGSLS